MSWDTIKAINPIVSRRKQAVRYIKDILMTKYNFPYNASVFQLDFYRLLKTMESVHEMSPSEILLIISKNPSLVNYIYRRKYKALKDALLQGSGNEKNRLTTFVTLVYDSYYKNKSIFKALLEVRKYPYDNFKNLKLLSVVKKNYPFVFSEDHLKHVKEKLDVCKYAVLLTENGIKERY